VVPRRHHPDVVAFLTAVFEDQRPDTGTREAAARRRERWLRIAAALVPVAATATAWFVNHWTDAIPRGDIVQITHSRAFEGQPSLAPDGRAIAYRCDARGNGDICVASIDGRDVVNLTADSPQDESEPAFSPDATTIAFRTGQSGIAVIARAGGPMTRITPTGQNPAWTPDGRALVYADETVPGRDFMGGITEGWRVEIDSKARRRIAASDFHQPSVSPAGRRIAFWGRASMPQNRRRLTSTRGDLWTVAVDGGAPQRVTFSPAVESSPMWSHDGRFLYYVANANGSSAIWRIRIDERSGRTTGAPEIVPTPYSQPLFLTRSADGRRVAWSDARPVNRIMRVAFDADARRTRGTPTEITPGGPEWEDSEVEVELQVAAPADPQAGAPPAGGEFPGHWSGDRRMFAGTSNGAVWIYSAETRSYAQLRTGEHPVWLLDSRRVLFASAGALYMGDAVLRISREILSIPDHQLDMPWLSRDNRFLYFAGNGLDANVWVMTVKNQ
jgi:dipeptidyl aminopeptidase/acylaminoacyl peptidase